MSGAGFGARGDLIGFKVAVTPTEADGRFIALEPAYRSVSSFDPAMVLLDPIVQISVGPVFHSVVQFGTNFAWITVVTLRRDTRRSDAGHRFRGSKERFC